MKRNFIFIFSFFISDLFAQFPGPVGTIGTTAMHKDSSAFVAWGKLCYVTRGYQDISTATLGLATVGDSSNVIAKADGSIVSLGDGGIAIVTFTNPITNGPGYDFAVFENAFNDTFLELAFVEVSSDGINYFRFPATCNLPTSPQYTNDAAMDATKIDNLAGKYRSLYGTPFDLQELSGIIQLDITSITHLKIIDVVGSINTLYSNYDKNLNIINDPWPTPFSSSGFDLDAVGVINASGVGIEKHKRSLEINIFPNPVSSELRVRSSEFKGKTVLKIRDLLGNEIRSFELYSVSSELDISDLNPGIYFVSIENETGKSITKLIKE